MLRHFRKDAFEIRFRQENKSVIVSLSKCGYDNGNAAGNYQLGLVPPGNVYMLSHTGWIQIDVNALSRKQHYLERACDALINGILRLKIGSSCLQLSLLEIKLLETVLYDLILNSLNWLPDSDIYCLFDNKIIVNNKTYSLSESVRTIFGSVKSILNGFVNTVSEPHCNNGVKIMISPARSDKNGKSVIIETVQIKKAPEPLVLPPIKIKPDPNYVPMENKFETNKDFYDLVRKRGRWMKEHPNLADEMFPNRHEDHKLCMKYETNQKKLKTNRKKNVENLMKSMTINAFEIKKKNKEEEMKKILEKKEAIQKELETERMIRLQIIQNKQKLEQNKPKLEQKPEQNKPKLVIIKKDEESESDDESSPSIVPDSVFIKAKEHVLKKCHPLPQSITQSITQEKTSDEEDWFDTITKSANPDIVIRKTESESIMDEVVDSMFSSLSINPSGF